MTTINCDKEDCRYSNETGICTCEEIYLSSYNNKNEEIFNCQEYETYAEHKRDIENCQ